MVDKLTVEEIMEAETPIKGTFMMGDVVKDIAFGQCKCIHHEMLIENSSLGTLDFTGFHGRIELKNCHIKGIILEDKDVLGEKRSPPFKIENCGVEGVQIHSKMNDILEMKKNKFTGITNFSGSELEDVDLSESNFDYTIFTGVKVNILKLETCRFCQLFDMSGTKAGKISFLKAIVLETFVLPEITDPGFGEFLNFTDMCVNGKVLMTMPIGQSFENAFIKSFYKGCNPSEMVALRQILESNRRYSAADTAYIYLKRKECEETRKGEDVAVLTSIQRRITRFSYYLGGNGMRPSYTLGWLVVIAMIFGLIMAIVGVENPYAITGNLILDDLYLSFTSLFLGGILDIKGIGAAGYVICLIEGIIGLFLMLYFTVILTRKFIR